MPNPRRLRPTHNGKPAARFAAAAVLLAAASAQAAPFYWIDPAGGEFNDNGNWSASPGGIGGGAGVPGASDSANLDRSTGTIDFTGLAGGVTNNGLLVSQATGAATTATLNLTDAGTPVTYTVTGSGAANQGLVVAGNANHASTLSLTGGGTLSTTNGASGQMLTLANGNNSNATLNVTNGTLRTGVGTAGYLRLGFATTGARATLNVNGGGTYQRAQWRFTAVGNSAFGGDSFASTSRAVINVTDGGYVEGTGGDLYFGYAGNATEGGNPAAGATVTVSGVGFDGVAYQPSTFKRIGGNISVAHTGKAEFRILDGGLLDTTTGASGIQIGGGIPGSTGSLLVDGVNATSGIRSRFAGGTIAVSGNGTLSSPTTSILTVQGGGRVEANRIVVGLGSTTYNNASLTVAGSGSQVTTGDFYTAYSSSQHVNSTISVTNGGLFLITNDATIGTAATSPNVNVTIDGAQSEMRLGYFAALGGAAGSTNVTVSNGGLLRTTTALATTLAASAKLTLDGGTFNMAGNGAIHNNGVIAGGGTIGRGSGTTAITVNNNSSLTPGTASAAGTLVMDFANLNQTNANGVTDFDLDNPAVGYDQVHLTNGSLAGVTGTVTINNGAITFGELNTVSTAWGKDLTYDLMTARVITISQSILDAAELQFQAMVPDATMVSLSVLPDALPNSTDVLRLSFHIPEPASLTLLALGAATVFRRRR